jgi:primosomal protein N' (replication factor Y)
VERRKGEDPTKPDRPGAKKQSLKARWTRVHEEVYVRLGDGVDRATKLRGDKQSELFAILAARGEVSITELKQQLKNPRPAIDALHGKGLITLEAREVPDDPFFGAPVPRDTPPALTPAQADAVEAITQAVTHGERANFLLHGVTGSGKTEVYLRAMAAAAAKGRSAVLMLPEIALTPQLVARYRARFGDNLAVLHSGLKDDERHAMWRKLHRGECHVAIGARSAVFAPVKDLGLILVDEEHDPSFKQDDHFRYHGRDMALLRAHRAGVPCVLGSATPSVETYHAAMEGRYRLLSLPDRATNAAMPSIEIVDLKRVGPRGPTGHELLSLPLVRALEATLKRKEQAILFLNRRGFAPSVRCPRCAVSLECPSCSVTLVLHRRASALRCHYCDFNAPFANACITCGCTELTLIGVGTEKLEHALVSSFPGARIGRLDRDVASGMGAEEVLDKLRRGDLDVLVGTQMVTKGHDIARVTLVGVIAADATLAFPDFRATERTFQLLSQVAGRAGRRELPGHVVIQTWQPEHPVLLRAKTHDYEGFYSDEVSARAELGYPPFGRLAALKLDAPDEAQLQRTAAQMDELLRATADVLRQTLRRSDVICRFGGEEFLVVLAETAPDDATVLAARLFVAIEAAGAQPHALQQQLATIAQAVQQSGADTVVLGCTHYPLVADALQQLLGPGTTLVDTADAIARRVARVVGDAPASGRAPGLRLFSTANPADLTQAARRWLQTDTVAIHLALPGDATTTPLP